MKPDEESPRRPSRNPEAMGRRSFLKTSTGALGLTASAAFFGIDALRQVKAAVGDIAGLTPQQAAREESFWREIQQAFSVTRSVVNLNNAWTCPSPRIVTEAVVRYIWEQEDGPALHMREFMEPHKDKVRISLARQFGVSSEEIAVVRNATEALQNVLVGVPLEPGDEILASNASNRSGSAAAR